MTYSLQSFCHCQWGYRSGCAFSGYLVPAAGELVALWVREEAWGAEMGIGFSLVGLIIRKQTVSTCFRKDHRRIHAGRSLGGL